MLNENKKIPVNVSSGGGVLLMLDFDNEISKVWREQLLNDTKYKVSEPQTQKN